MRGVTIDDQINWASLPLHEALQERDKCLRHNSTFDNHEPQVPLRTDGGNHVEAESLACDPHDRRLAFWRPRRSSVKIGAYPRLVFEENFRALSFCCCPDPRILRLQSELDCLWVLLPSSKQRFLAGKPQLNQKPTNRAQA